MRKLYVFLLLILVLPISVSAANKELVTYDISATVNLDKTVDIEETYHVYFVEDVINLDRIIDTKFDIVRPNKTKRTVNLKVNNIMVEDSKFTIKKQDDKEIISFRADGIKDSVKQFSLSYTIDFGKDTGIGFDELFLKLVDGNYHANVNNINFSIAFPKEINTDKIRFLWNNKYNLTDDDVNYSVKNNTIYGVFERSLGIDQSFSFYIELPDNYFIGTKDHSNYFLLLTLILPIISIIYGVYNYFRFAKGNKVAGKITTEPPYNYDPAEVSFLYNGYSKETDIVALLIYLANNQYIMFEESDDGYKLDRPNSFKIIKLKDYDGENAAQKILFEKLFQKDDIIELKDIEYNLFDTLMLSKSTLDNKQNKKRLFLDKIKKIKLILLILISIAVVSINFYPIYSLTEHYYFIPILAAIMIFGLYILFVADTKIFVKIIFGGGLTIGSMYGSILPIIHDPFTISIYIVGMIIIFISCFLYHLLPNRTIYGNHMLGEMYGFKSGLLSLSDISLKEKLQENPNYYFEMLPYVQLFDITEQWYRKGKTVISSYPSWYVTKEEFSLQNLFKFMKNMIYLTTQAMFKRQLPGMSETHVEYKKDSKVKNIEEK